MDKPTVQQLNERILSTHVKGLKNILVSIPYGALARFDTTCKLWTYLKFKGPTFLVEDSQKEKSIVIMNQVGIKDYVLRVQSFHKFECETIQKQGYMLNFASKDSISGYDIYGIWTDSEKIKLVHKFLTE